jgi:hypothetical protein
MAVGYSGTPLPKKLGIKAPMHVAVMDSPAPYSAILGEEVLGVTFSATPTKASDIVHVFCTERATLDKYLKKLRALLAPTASIWVSWPKKSSKVGTNITEDTIRELALPLGLVDVKVCAVSEVWSGLKLVVRKELRCASAA